MKTIYTPDELRQITENAKQSQLADEEIQAAFIELNKGCYYAARKGADSYEYEYNEKYFKYVSLQYALERIVQICKDWGFSCKVYGGNTVVIKWEEPKKVKKGNDYN